MTPPRLGDEIEQAFESIPEIGDAVREDPLVSERAAGSLADGSMPLSRRLRDRRTIASIIVPIAVLSLFVVALPGFELDKMAGYILAADPFLLLAAFVIYYVGFPLRGYRWSLLLRGVGTSIRVRDATEILFIGWMVNTVVPAKLGEIYRAWLLKTNLGTPMSSAFGTIFIERIFDIFAIVILGLGAAFWSFRSGMDEGVRAIVLVGIAVVVVLAAGLLAVRNFGRRLVERLPLPARIANIYEHFEAGLFSTDRRSLPLIVLLTLLIWSTEALRLLFIVEAMDFEVSLGISGAFFVALVASLLTAVPFTPAGLGVVEVGVVGLLTVVYGATPSEAAAITLIDRAIAIFSVVILGFIAYLLSPRTKGRHDRHVTD